MKEKRRFPLAVVFSFLTELYLATQEEMDELASFLLGKPVTGTYYLSTVRNRLVAEIPKLNSSETSEACRWLKSDLGDIARKDDDPLKKRDSTAGETIDKWLAEQAVRLQCDCFEIEDKNCRPES